MPQCRRDVGRRRVLNQLGSVVEQMALCKSPGRRVPDFNRIPGECRKRLSVLLCQTFARTCQSALHQIHDIDPVLNIAKWTQSHQDRSIYWWPHVQ